MKIYLDGVHRFNSFLELNNSNIMPVKAKRNIGVNISKKKSTFIEMKQTLTELAKKLRKQSGILKSSI